MRPRKTGMSPAFLSSRRFYVSLVIAFAGAQVDWVLTAFGLVLGYRETRPFFSLHAVALFAVIFLMYLSFYEKRPKFISYLCLAFAIASPAVPIASNLFVLVTGRLPFL